MRNEESGGGVSAGEQLITATVTLLGLMVAVVVQRHKRQHVLV